MALNKESISINFSQGLDTIDDPNQMPIGKFTTIQNSEFIKSNSGLVSALKKANGFTQLSNVVSTVSYLSSYNGSLLGTGPNNVQVYSANANAWINQGTFQPVSLSVRSLIKNGFSQSSQDTALSPNGLICVAYSSGDLAGTYKYAIFDSATGQSVISPTTLPVVTIGSTGQIMGQSQVYSLGSSYFIAYATTASSVANLVVTQVQNISPFALVNTKIIDTNIVFSSTFAASSPTTNPSAKSAFDGTVFNNSVYLAWLNGLGSSALNAAIISPTFSVSSVSIGTNFGSGQAVSITGDAIGGSVYITVGSQNALKAVSVSSNLSSITYTTSWSVNSANFLRGGSAAKLPIANIASYANNGVLHSYYEVPSQFFAATLGLRPNNILSRAITVNGSVSTEAVVAYSMGLGSKAFVMNNQPYMFSTYGASTFQQTYFLISSSGQIISKFAYGTGGGFYFTGGLPSVNVIGSTANVSYLTQDLVISQANAITSSASTYVYPPLIFSQTGINYGSFAFTSQNLSAKDTGNCLSYASGFLWNYDGFQLTENNFFLYPEIQQFITSTISTSSMRADQAYQYQVVYEWSDNQANVHQSTPSVPLTLSTISGSAGVVAQASIIVPTLNATYRTPSSPNKATLYRWSQNQQTFYKVGSYVMDGTFTTGSLSSYVGNTGLAITQSSFGSFTFLDTASDTQILGNEIIYTNGNVLEDVGLPACSSAAIWDSRLWVILSEIGQVAFSKPIIAATPIEMSLLETLSIPPSQTGQGSTGLPTCIYPMDDKLIVFEKNSIRYINGNGPDLTGNSSTYSSPTLIPSSVGTNNPNSIVVIPNGLMFQSDNGIWLLERNLSLSYIGKEVEAYNSLTVSSVIASPGTTEVRFTLNNGQILTYDYLAQQWIIRQTNLLPQSSIIYNGLHTTSNSQNQVFQETSNLYQDGTQPMVMSFTTGWLSLSGLQGYQRAYWMDILATFQSPHTYTIGIAYNYNPTITQTATVNPNPYNVVGSGSQMEQWEVAFKYPQCQSFQLTFNEIASGSAGAGLTISAINLTYGKKKTFPRNISPRNKIS